MKPNRVATPARVLFAAVLSLAACGDPATAPPIPSPWFVGTWRAVTVDGVPVPARLVTGTARIRVDSLSVSFGSGVIHSFSRAETLELSKDVSLDCGGLVERTVKGDTVFVTGSYRGMNSCPYAQLSGRRFVRDGERLAHEWEGRRYSLAKVAP
jgi:hypothetical protein